MHDKKNKLKVYISATGPDVAYLLQDIRRVIYKSDATPVSPPIHTRDPDKYYYAITECNVYILVVGHCYGHLVEGDDKSVAEKEYDWVVETLPSMERMVVFASGNFLYQANLREADNLADKQKSFRKRLKEVGYQSEFTTKKELQEWINDRVWTMLCRSSDKKDLVLDEDKDKPKLIVHGDYYDNRGSQLGAQGPYSKASDNQFLQDSRTRDNSVDFDELASQLNKLRQTLKKEAQFDEHDVAIGKVAEAEQAAKAGDDSKVAEHLKTAGQWALDVARKIGVPVAEDALRQALAKP